MTPQEQHDLDTMNAKVQEIKLKTFSYLTHLNRYDRRELDTSGFRGMTNAEAMQLTFRTRLREIDQLHKAHIRKYPD